MYHLLFYKGYQAAMRTGNFGGYPVLGGCFPVASCALLNFLSFSMIAERLYHWNNNALFRQEYKWVICIAFILLTLSYFLVGERYERIVARYERIVWVRDMPGVLVLVVCYTLSFVFALLAGMYKNHDGPFR